MSIELSKNFIVHLIDKKTFHRFLFSMFLICSTALLFWNLQAYPLWDDEANTALFGESVWHTGKPFAILHHNIIGFNDGSELDNQLINRRMSPLQYYVAAPFVGLFKASSFMARFPFALAGLGTILIIYYWLKKCKASTETLIITMVGMLSSVPFFLYCRNARYYSLVILFTTLIAFLYERRAAHVNYFYYLILGFFLLLLSSYMTYAIITCTILIDYFFFGKKEAPYTKKQMLCLLGSQIFPCLLVFLSISKGNTTLLTPSTLNDYFVYLQFAFNNLHTSEMLPFTVILISIFLLFIENNTPYSHALGRLNIAILFNVFLITYLLSMPMSNDHVRYYVQIIPMSIAITVILIKMIPWPKVRYIATFFIFFTPLIYKPFSSETYHLETIRSSTFANYIRELKNPPQTAYATVSRWLNKHVKPGASLLVRPDYATYPLMFHSAQFVYAWQLLNYHPAGWYIDPINYRDQSNPEYIVEIFGNNFYPGYHLITTLPIYDTLYRPEIVTRYTKVEKINLLTAKIYKRDI